METAISSNYFCKFFNFDSQKAWQNRLSEKIKKVDFDIVFMTGWSGALTALPFCLNNKIPFAIIRKKGEQTHSCQLIEGHLPFGTSCAFKYVIIDDSVCSGSTVLNIRLQINKEYPNSKLEKIFVKIDQTDEDFVLKNLICIV